MTDRPPVSGEPSTRAGQMYWQWLRVTGRITDEDRGYILAIEADAAQGAAPRPDILAMTNEDELDDFAEWAASDEALFERAAPRAEGLDVERIRSMAIYVEKYDRDMVPLDDVLAVLDNFVPADIDADGQARAILARLSRPSDEVKP